MLVKLAKPEAFTVSLREVVRKDLGFRLYPYALKALAWGKDVLVPDEDVYMLRTVFKAHGLELLARVG